MNATLEKAITEAKAFPPTEQQAVGEEILDLLEKRLVVRELEASEAEGGESPALEVFDHLRERLKTKHGL